MKFCGHDAKVQLYCKDDRTFTCSDCIVKNHLNHKLEEINPHSIFLDKCFEHLFNELHQDVKSVSSSVQQAEHIVRQQMRTLFQSIQVQLTQVISNAERDTLKLVHEGVREIVTNKIQDRSPEHASEKLKSSFRRAKTLAGKQSELIGSLKHSATIIDEYKESAIHKNLTTVSLGRNKFVEDVSSRTIKALETIAFDKLKNLKDLLPSINENNSKSDYKLKEYEVEIHKLTAKLNEQELTIEELTNKKEALEKQIKQLGSKQEEMNQNLKKYEELLSESKKLKSKIGMMNDTIVDLKEGKKEQDEIIKKLNSRLLETECNRSNKDNVSKDTISTLKEDLIRERDKFATLRKERDAIREEAKMIKSQKDEAIRDYEELKVKAILLAASLQSFEDIKEQNSDLINQNKLYQLKIQQLSNEIARMRSSPKKEESEPSFVFRRLIIRETPGFNFP